MLQKLSNNPQNIYESRIQPVLIAKTIRINNDITCSVLVIIKKKKNTLLVTYYIIRRQFCLKK